MPQSYPPPASNTLLGNHHIHIFLSWWTRQFIALIINYRNSSRITQMIIINITIGTVIWIASNANINSTSKIKKSVANTHPIIQMTSDITIIVPKNDANAFMLLVFVVCYIIKYNKFYGVSIATDKESGCSLIAIEFSDISFNCFSAESSLL